MKRSVALILLALVLAGLLAVGFLRKNVPERDIFAMDTVIHLKVEGSDAALSAAKQEIFRLDRMLSVNGNGELAAVNRGEAPGSELSSLTDACKSITELTNGAFDVTMYPVLRLWGFTTGSYRVPEKEEIETALAERGQELDFGAAAKGYGADCVRNILEEYGVKKAEVSLGGTVLLYGKDETRVGIKAPDGDGCAAYIRAKDCVISTSGGYERYFEEDGKRYCHILDPATGYPASNGLLSVTVVAQNGLYSDALSTAIFVMGEAAARRLWETGDFECVLLTEDGRAVVTEGLADGFTSTTYETEIWNHE